MNDKKQIFGWVMYDWANSAYITTVTVAVLPIYFADVIVGKDGLNIGGINFSATTLWAWMIGFSAFVIFLCAPVLGAISDFSSSKKKFLMVFCYTGCVSTVLLIFCGTGDVLWTMIIFMIAQIGFVGGNVFYDAFLPRIASEDKLDWVSGKGYAYGYIGGGLQYAFSLVLITGHNFFGISQSLAIRLAMSMAGIWWGGFAVITFIKLKEAKSPEYLPEAYLNMSRWLAYMKIGISRTISTARKVKNFKHLVLFLVAFMIYNDGIQTVITMATIYGREEMGFSIMNLMVTLLIIQFVAFFGSLIFAKLGEKISTKKALMITLVLWSFVVVYAYFMTTAREYYILGIIVGISLGGSQSLSRSLYGSIIPVHASAEFYGFYSVFSKFSAIWGPLVFGIINTLAGSSRQAIVSLIIFFIIGLILLSMVNVEKAREAKTLALFSE